MIQLRSYCDTGRVPEDEIWLYTVAVEPWPKWTVFARERLLPSELLRQRGVLFGRWPWLRFRVKNGHAVYKLTTCERGQFVAYLVDHVYIKPLAQEA
jgi:hypothetical protein